MRLHDHTNVHSFRRGRLYQPRQTRLVSAMKPSSKRRTCMHLAPKSCVCTSSLIFAPLIFYRLGCRPVARARVFTCLYISKTGTVTASVRQQACTLSL